MDKVSEYLRGVARLERIEVGLFPEIQIMLDILPHRKLFFTDIASDVWEIMEKEVGCHPETDPGARGSNLRNPEVW